MTPFPWPLAAILPDEPDRFAASILRAADLGFTRVEIAALTDRPDEHLEALAESGLLVSCARLSGDLCHGGGERRRAVLGILKRQVEDAARLGAAFCLLSPGPSTGPESLIYFSEGCKLLWEHAKRKRTTLLVLPAARTCLPDGAAADEWLRDFPTFGLALDATDPFVRGRNARLSYVRLEEGSPTDELALALKAVGYRGPVVGIPLGSE
jgi:sugar phosphate isomerase/epimerase